MKYSKLLILTFFIFILFLGVKCKKDPPAVIKLSQEFKDYIYFQKGTYWVYQDTANLSIDSNLVVNNEIKIIEESRERPKKIIRRTETFYNDIKSYFTGIIYKHGGSGLGCSENTQDRVCFIASRATESEATTFIVLIPPIIGTEEHPNGLTTITLTNLYDSLKIGNKYFYNVIRMHETRNVTENAKETAFYIAKNIGIIRKEINLKEDSFDPDNWQVWDLVRYNIIQ